LTSTTYGGERYISAVQKGCVVATQFHPEKSGKTGLNFIKGFLEVSGLCRDNGIEMSVYVVPYDIL